MDTINGVAAQALPTDLAGNRPCQFDIGNSS
jgi:hypothetical protein